MRLYRGLLIIITMVFLAACSGRPYQPYVQPMQPTSKVAMVVEVKETFDHKNYDVGLITGYSEKNQQYPLNWNIRKHLEHVFDRSTHPDSTLDVDIIEDRSPSVFMPHHWQAWAAENGYEYLVLVKNATICAHETTNYIPSLYMAIEVCSSLMASFGILNDKLLVGMTYEVYRTGHEYSVQDIRVLLEANNPYGHTVSTWEMVESLKPIMACLFEYNVELGMQELNRGAVMFDTHTAASDSEGRHPSSSSVTKNKVTRCDEFAPVIKEPTL